MLAGRNPKVVWFLSLVFGVALPALASPANRIHQVRLSQESGLTVVEIAGDRALNFTTFKQDAPKRVVVDMAECSFTGVPRSIVGDGKLVEAISTSEITGGAHNVSRVVINLSREVEYRVTARGGSLFIYLTPGTGGLLVSAGIPMAPERVEPKVSPDLPKTSKNTNLSFPMEEEVKPIQLAMATPKDTPARVETYVEPARELTSAPVVEPKPAPVPTPNSIRVVESEPEPTEPVEEPIPVPAAEPAIEPKPAPVVESKPAPKPAPVIEQKVAPAPKPAPVTEQKVAPAPKPAPVIEQKIAPAPKPAPVIEQKVAPAPKPAPVIEQKIAPAPKSTAVAEVKPALVPEPKLEPVVAPKPVYNPEPKLLPVTKQKPELVAMIQPQPARDHKLTPAKTEEQVKDTTPLPSPAKSMKAEKVDVPPAVDTVDEAAAPSSVREEQIEDISPPEPPKAAADEAPQKLKIKSDEAPYRPPRATEFVSRVDISRSTKKMTWVGFQQTQDSSQVFVKTNEPVRYRIIEETAQLVILELENTSIPKRNDRRFLDTHFFNTAVTMITPREVSGPGRTVRVEIQLKDRVPYTTGQESNVVFVRFELPK
jgi:hypothetical protein